MDKSKSLKLSIPNGAKALHINWPSALAIVSLHLWAFAIFIPWLFDWRSFLLLVVAVPFFGFGINMCYHRQLAHRSFRTPRWLEHTFVSIALCCLQDTPAIWVANHRIHHAKSDQPNDPHSPLVTFFWSHCGWLFFRNADVTPLTCYQQYVRDILSDRWYMRLEKGYLREWIYFGHATLFFLAAATIEWFLTHNFIAAIRFGLSVFIWGVVLRTVIIWHITWSVNSLCHLFGYRSYDTHDQSKNNILVGFVAAGEGWHNNHHSFPACATTRRRWWELDLVYCCGIKPLQKLGLAFDVVELDRK